MTLSRDLEEILNIQYQSASISHKNLIDAQMQTLMLNNQMEDLHDQLNRIQLTLSRDLELETLFPEVFIPAIYTDLRVVTTENAVSGVHPRLRQLHYMLEEAQAQQSHARADYLPDLRIGLDYILTDKKITEGVEISESGKNPFTVSAGISLPLWNWGSKRAALGVSQWQEQRSQSLRNREAELLEEDHQTTLSLLNESLRQIDLYKDELLPRAMEIEQVTEQNYVSQGADISDLTLARQHVLDLQLGLADAQRTARVQNAILTYLKGN